MQEDSIENLKKDSILQSSHSNEENCHYTYNAFFNPAEEELSEDHQEVLQTFDKRMRMVVRAKQSAKLSWDILLN